MSLYNMLFGVNGAASVLLAALNIKKEDIPRFRDCYLDGEEIVIHTRTGGGNRDYYDAPNIENPEGPWNSTLQSHPCYLRDEDDDFDSTYADFHFRFPEEYAPELKALSAQAPPERPSEMWQSLLKELKESAEQKKEVSK